MSQQINLFNPIFKQQKKYLSAVTMAQALGLILLGALLLSGYAMYRSTRLNAQAVLMSNQLIAAQATLAKVDVDYAPRGKNKSLELEIQKTETGLKSLQQVSEILAQGDLGNTQGYANYMRAFARQIMDGVWLTGFSIHGAGTEIGLQGKALNPELIPAYIGRLRSEPVLQGKSFSRLEMQVPQTVRADKNPASGSMAVPINHIEFNLQSTGSPVLSGNAGVSGK